MAEEDEAINGRDGRISAGRDCRVGLPAAWSTKRNQKLGECENGMTPDEVVSGRGTQQIFELKRPTGNMFSEATRRESLRQAARGTVCSHQRRCPISRRLKRLIRKESVRRLTRMAPAEW